jgi:TIR domain
VAYRALLIGVSRYEHMPMLLGPVRELAMLRDALTSAPGSPFTPNTVFTLPDSSLIEARNRLLDFLISAEADDDLLIFFSGHSYIERDELYLLLADSEPGGGASQGLSTEWLSGALERTLASSVFLILDTSLAGSFKLPDSPRLKDDPTAYYFIGSAGPTEQALDNGLFAAAVSAALHYSLVSTDGGIHPQFVFEEVFNRLAPDGIRPFYAARGARTGSQRQVSPSPGQKSIFISYAHEDERWLKKLRPHLESLVQDVAEISYWDDGNIKAGEDWRAEIRSQLSGARAALLLVSADFLASEFIRNDELPTLLSQAESRKTRLYCLILRPCRFDRVPVLSKFQSVNAPDKTLSEMRLSEQERTFVRLIDQLEQALG